MEQFVLASASPRRRELLLQIGLPFSVIPSQVEEVFENGKSPEELSILLAKKKAQAVVSTLPENFWVLGVDTFIWHKDQFIGKPKDREEARRMLKAFSGSTHKVISGLALVHKRNRWITDYSCTMVTFRDLTEKELEWYLDTEEWAGVAGAYRIQEKAACFINQIDGSFSNVMGLPIHTFYDMLRRSNYPFP